MIGAMLRGFLIGPVILVGVAYFWSNPTLFWWVLAIVAVPFAIAAVLGIGDGLAQLRAAKAPPPWRPGIEDDAPPAERFDNARLDLAKHRRLRARFDGWRYRSPVARPRAAERLEDG